MTDSQKLCLKEAAYKYTVESNIIIGCSSLAGLYTSTTDQNAKDTISIALDSGAVQFDTAPHYGCGLSEKRLGMAIRDLCSTDQIKSLRIWSKVGRLMIPINPSDGPSSEFDESDDSKVTLESFESLEAAAAGRTIETGNVPGSPQCIFPDAPRNVFPVFDYSSAGVDQSHSDSLKRLGLGCLHGLRIHDCNSEVAIADVLLESQGGLAALIKMRSDNLIQDVSIGVNHPKIALEITRAVSVGCLDSVMIAGSWNLLDHSESALELLIECQSRNITVHNAGIFASGLIVGGSTYLYGPAPDYQVDRMKRWMELCVEYDIPLPAVAIRFALLPSIVSAVAIGVKDSSEVLQSVEWLKCNVPDSLFIEAKRRGLIASHVPLCNHTIE